jgi:hypothetical protein
MNTPKSVRIEGQKPCLLCVHVVEYWSGPKCWPCHPLPNKPNWERKPPKEQD